jgi:FkbM family methyltransferase
MRVVDAPFRFAVNQSCRRAGIHTYRLRGSEIQIALRHGTLDNTAFTEVFVHKDYLPPAPVAEVIASLASPRILDLGANIGAYALWALARDPTSRILSVEADPHNAAMLRTARDLNPGASWELLEAAATNAPGTVSFAAGHEMGSHIARAEDQETIMVEAVDALPLLDDCDIAKIDIEGAEWEIISDQRLRGCEVRAIVVEYHAREGLSAATAVEYLRAATFEVYGPVVKSPDMGLIWGYRPSSNTV